MDHCDIILKNLIKIFRHFRIKLQWPIKRWTTRRNKHNRKKRQKRQNNTKMQPSRCSQLNNVSPLSIELRVIYMHDYQQSVDTLASTLPSP